jgi:hypothetical protein
MALSSRGMPAACSLQGLCGVLHGTVLSRVSPRAVPSIYNINANVNARDANYVLPLPASSHVICHMMDGLPC